MRDLDAVELTLMAIEEAADLIDDLAGDGRGLSQAQIIQGSQAVLGLGDAQANLEAISQAADPSAPAALAARREELVKATDALRVAKAHIASYTPTGGLANAVAAATSTIDETLAAIAADLV